MVSIHEKNARDNGRAFIGFSAVFSVLVCRFLQISQQFTGKTLEFRWFLI